MRPASLSTPKHEPFYAAFPAREQLATAPSYQSLDMPCDDSMRANAIGSTAKNDLRINSKACTDIFGSRTTEGVTASPPSAIVKMIRNGNIALAASSDAQPIACQATAPADNRLDLATHRLSMHQDSIANGGHFTRYGGQSPPLGTMIWLWCITRNFD